MKRLFIVVMAFLPILCIAQNVWERPKVDKKTAEIIKINPDQPYLAGSVPEVDGKVVFECNIPVKDKSQKNIYDIVLQYLTDMSTEEGQVDNRSFIALKDSDKGVIVAKYREWLVFMDKALALDRTKFDYQIIAKCTDNNLNIAINNISYDYGTGGDDYHYDAETWITDKYGLNKKGNKLAKLSGKFRRKTIDRKDYIFKTIKEALTETDK